MEKSIKVFTNDTRTGIKVLSVSGTVKKFVSLSARHVVFNGAIGEPLRKVVTITQMPEFPFTITGVSAEKGEFIHFTLSEVPKQNPKKYQLTVENIRKTIGTYDDTIFLDTDSELQKRIAIRVIGRLHAEKR